MNDEPAADDVVDPHFEREQPRYNQPAGSDITIDRFPDGLTIQVPPAGIRRGGHGLFLGAAIALVIISIITFVLVFALVRGKVEGKNAAIIVPTFLSIFWLTSLGLLVAAINMGMRRAAIAVTGGTLMVIQTGLFGSKQRDWEPGDVESIRAGPSGVTVNGRALLELQIYDGGADKFAILCGRTDEELHWIASELQAALGLPARA